MNPTDSPIARCEEAHVMVRIDRTQEECAHEHQCPPGRMCPLAGCFANMFAAYRCMRGSVESSLVRSEQRITD